MLTLTINGEDRQLDVPEDMPLLWVLRDVAGLTGTKFGCGMALCGACTVHLDGQPVRSCVMAAGGAVGRKITTIEAIGDTPPARESSKAWLDLEVVQCGYCQSGQIMSAAALLAANPKPDRCGYRRSNERQYLPLRHLSAHQGRDQTGRRGLRETAMREPLATRGGPPVKRRAFLAGGAALVLAAALPVGSRIARAAAGIFEPNAFIRIGDDGTIVLIMRDVEMGQGIWTGASMLLAEELDVGLDQVTPHFAPPNDKLYANPLIGFSRRPADRHRYAATGTICARRVRSPAPCLSRRRRSNGASTLPAAASRAGMVPHAASGRTASYASLVPLAVTMPVPSEAPLKNSQGLDIHRHAAETSGYAGQGEWQDRLRDRRAGSRE